LLAVVVIAVVIIVTMLAVAGMLLCIGVSGVLLRGSRQLIEEMMHPMGSRRDQEKTKRDGCTQVEAALKFRDRSSGFHRVFEPLS
jgi:hypothetical protein